MPDAHTIVVFAAAAVVLIAVPGPNLIYIAARSVADGRRAGLVSVLGVETGTLIHSAAAAAGLSALLASSATAFAVVKYAGALYLVYLGFRALLGSDPEPDGTRPPPMRLSMAYRQGVMVQVLNPKVALFFIAFLPQFLDPSRGRVALQAMVLGLTLGVLGATISSLYALGAAALGDRLRASPKLARRQRLASGAVLLALGVAAAVTGGRGEG